MSHRLMAKATMHGFGMVARQHLETPPGGGALSQHLAHAPALLYAATLISTRHDERNEVQTTHYFVELHEEGVELFRRTAAAAANLLLALRAAQLSGLQRNSAWHLHGGYLDRLTAEQQAELRGLAGRS